SLVLLQDEDKPLAMDASVLWSDSSQTRYQATRVNQSSNDSPQTGRSTESDATKSSEDEQTITERPPAPKPPGSDKENKPEDSAADALQSVACEINYPLGAYGRTAPPEQPEVLLIKNATVWTCDEAGILEHTDILVRRGMIVQVGQNLESVKDAQVMDASGMHVSPGIIDCHSHMATDGGVNESGQTITAEVRIGDFIDSNDITIYRQLAGGVTTSNILHGSANPIGGQNQVIKLRWGSLDEDLKMREAPAGIKFALGENVKQSNHAGGSTRYPQSRMGVEQLMRDRLEAARDYREHWQHPEHHANSLPPRRDLELEALVEVLEGRRWIHCHSYRQDEILMVLRLLEDYDVTIGSLQHILEGYKVADAMAAHGATGSSFSDWWAYKIEVLDAIPYNGAVMHRAGVVVSFNSDDAELARHLNHEAAKAIKYGGVDPSEALKFVTMNPAKQLRIDNWVGSITVGKQADLVIWNRSPLSTLSVCMQTWIDGRKYFDREQEQIRHQQDEQLRLKLIQLAAAQPGDKEEEANDKDPSLWWARYDEFCHHGHGHGHGHGHDDDE
ncbi:MAG: amidohydrolase, partial [Planctomycetales bacterium]|nr:amidohydrolase [Planctomycetales bacterium]